MDVNAADHPLARGVVADARSEDVHLQAAQGVKFHDGTDFNADAVKFNVMRYLTDPKSLRESGDRHDSVG